MDGIGYGAHPESDAVHAAPTPHLDWLHQHALATRLKAHGTAVGMPSDADMGNSEIGHNAIGCGRVFAQGAKLVQEALADGAMFNGAAWQELIGNCLEHGSTLHFLGLFSDGNVHSHLDHLRAMIARAATEGVARLRVHALLDGRDVGETSALEYIDPFEDFLDSFRQDGLDYCIASGGGRMQVTMDRYEANWDIVRQGWETHVQARGRQFASAHDAIVALRRETNAIDQDLPPFVIANDNGPVGPVCDHDSLIMFNFRGDRAIEISRAFEQDDFNEFDRGDRPDVVYAGMMLYDGDTSTPRRFLVQPPHIDRTMSEFLVRAGTPSLAISETQKFGHVTYFFNGNRSAKFSDELEDYVEVPSDIVPFEERPWMKAAEVTDGLLAAIAAGRQRFLRVNYANGDMVGHTGNFQAATIAVATVDLAIGRLLPAVQRANGVLIVTADHGNAEEMYELDKKSGEIAMEDGKPKAKTSHTLNPVPCLIYDPCLAGEYRLRERSDLGVSSLAATCLNLLGFQAPADYDPSVIEIA